MTPSYSGQRVHRATSIFGCGINSVLKVECLVNLWEEVGELMLPVMRLNLAANLGEILVIAFPDKSQLFSSVWRMRWNTASGTWMREHSDKSEMIKFCVFR